MFYIKFYLCVVQKVYFAYRFYLHSIMYSAEFEIHEEGSMKYKIVFSNYSEALIKSIVHSRLIPDISVYNDYRTITFSATSVQTYTEFRDQQLLDRNGVKQLNYEQTMGLVSSLASQLKYLIETHNSCFYLFDADNLIVIDDNKFLYMSNDHMATFTSDGKVMLIQPFGKKIPKTFVSPELTRIICIPSKVDYRSIYYSLGSLAMHGLIGDNFENKDAVLGALKGTKLYAMLQRCLAEDPCERSILFI